MKQIDWNLIHPYVALRAKQVLKEMEDSGNPFWFYEGYRSPEKQKELYDQGRTKPGKIVTWAEPGFSWHQYGLALDGAFIPDEKIKDPWSGKRPWDLYGELASKNGFSWGGDWKRKDKPHIQIILPIDIKALYTTHKDLTLAHVWDHLDSRFSLDRPEWDRALVSSYLV